MLTLAVLFAFTDPPKITISKETTYITGPLRDDGMVDYAQAFIASQGTVKPEENAAVALLQAIGPVDKWGGRAKRLYERLGCPPPSKDGNYVKDDLEVIGEDETPPEPKPQNLITFEAYSRLRIHPWIEADNPLVARLLERNQRPLDLFIEATKRRVYWEPYIPPTSSSPGDFLPIPQISPECRPALRLLQARIMLHIGRGEVDQGLAEIDALHRLSELLNNGARTDLEANLATLFRPVIFKTERVAVFSGKLTLETLRRRIKKLAELPEFGTLSPSVHDAERFTVLAFLTHAFQLAGDAQTPSAKQPFDQIGQWVNDWPITGKQSYSSATADECLNTVNRWFARYFEASGRGTTRERKSAVLELKSKLKVKAEEARRRFKETPNKARPPNIDDLEFGRMVAEICLASFISERSFDAPMSAETARRLTVLAYACTIFKMENGEYPGRLDAVVLGIPAAMLIDPFTDKPFVDRVVNGKRQIVGASSDGVVIPPGEKQPPGGYDIILELP
jgi:hypothetical protein